MLEQGRGWKLGRPSDLFGLLCPSRPSKEVVHCPFLVDRAGTFSLFFHTPYYVASASGWANGQPKGGGWIFVLPGAALRRIALRMAGLLTPPELAGVVGVAVSDARALAIIAASALAF